VEYDANGILTRCSTNKEEISAKGELVGIHKLSSTFYRQMCAEYDRIVSDKPKLGYEYQLLWMSQNVSPVYVYNASDVKWYEIDDEDDLKYAEEHVINRL
jgi:2-aminoethylphosphonate-pyruvate transaminase